MATIINPNGLLEYGDDDPRNPVIWRSPMTSELSISTPGIGGGSYVKVGTGQLFDPVKGLNTGNAGYYYIDNVTNASKGDYGMQVTFEVEREMIACLPSTSEGSSGGRAQTLVETFLGFNANPAPNSNYLLFFAINNKLLSLTVSDGVGASLYTFYFSDVHTKKQLIPITIASNGNTLTLYIDNFRVGNFTRSRNLPSPYYRLIFGRYPGDLTSFPLTSGYIHNVQFSSRPKAFVTPYLLSNGMAFGDSYADTYYGYATPFWNTEKSLAFEAEFTKRGMAIGGFVNQSYGGRKVIGSGNAALYLKDNIVTALALKPTLVIYQAGANDLTQTGTLDVSAFTASMKSHIEQFFGVNGNVTTTVKGMVVCSTPWAPQFPDVAQAILRKPDILSIQAIQSGLPAWFNATYPQLAGRLVFEDTFSYFGGFSPDPTLFAALDLVHPGPKGRNMMGNSWARGAAQLLR